MAEESARDHFDLRTAGDFANMGCSGLQIADLNHVAYATRLQGDGIVHGDRDAADPGDELHGALTAYGDGLRFRFHEVASANQTMCGQRASRNPANYDRGKLVSRACSEQTPFSADVLRAKGLIVIDGPCGADDVLITAQPGVHVDFSQ